MRWTYKLFIIIHLLFTAQSIAQPISSAVDRADTTQLWRRAKTRSPSPIVGAPKPKKQKITHQPSPQLPQRRNDNIRAKDLKMSTYRKKALRKAVDMQKTQTPGWNKAKESQVLAEQKLLQADHVFEAQTVSNYLNRYRGTKPIERKCKLAVRKILNHPDNLKMLAGPLNQSKGKVVTDLINHQPPSGSTQPFDPAVKKHIRDERSNIMNTAKQIDHLFTTTMPCEAVHVQEPDGLEKEAKRMLDHLRV